jgi:hypothetical protein
MLTLLASLPLFEVRGVTLGGGLVRQWLLNHILLSISPIEQGHQLVSWFATASAVQEWLMAMLITLNINAGLLLPLYGIGQGLIRISGWYARTELDLKRKGIR